MAKLFLAAKWFLNPLFSNDKWVAKIETESQEARHWGHLPVTWPDIGKTSRYKIGTWNGRDWQPPVAAILHYGQHPSTDDTIAADPAATGTTEAAPGPKGRSSTASTVSTGHSWLERPT